LYNHYTHIGFIRTKTEDYYVIVTRIYLNKMLYQIVKNPHTAFLDVNK